MEFRVAFVSRGCSALWQIRKALCSLPKAPRGAFPLNGSSATPDKTTEGQSLIVGIYRYQEMNTPTVAQKAPYMIDVEQGKTYYWCRCGLSQKQPLCDGSHKGTDFAPLAYVAMWNKTIAMCGCK